MTRAMKTLICQLWDEPELFGDYRAQCPSIKGFWKPCLQSVKQWAGENGFDYKRYTVADLEPLLPDLSLVEPIMLCEWDRLCIAKIGMLNNPDYDRVVVIDADVHIWENPQLVDGEFCIYVGERAWPQRNFPIFQYPQGGVYYTTKGPDVYKWCYDQFTNPSIEFEIIRRHYEFPNKKLIHGSGLTGFSEQQVLMAYIANHPWTDIHNHVLYGRTDNFYENSFVHFEGYGKRDALGRFRAGLLYTKIDEFYAQNVHKLKTKGIA